ncbi:MAG: alpha/beta hydrolase [Acidobacteriales bacterium]|nr:alpha/beta hydrolase [Terriglobales bacterium]
MKALNGFGYPVLRFNFRGTGLSAGEHDHGIGEREDVRSALRWLQREFGLPILFAGFSFGAAVGLSAACEDENVKGLVGLGVPIAPMDQRAYDFAFLQQCLRPKLFISGSRDHFSPKAQLEQLVQTLPEPRKMVTIEAADHFFEGRLREMRAAIEGWIEEHFAANRSPRG